MGGISPEEMRFLRAEAVTRTLARELRSRGITWWWGDADARISCSLGAEERLRTVYMPWCVWE